MSHMLGREWHKLLLENRLRFSERFWAASYHLLVNSFVYHRGCKYSILHSRTASKYLPNA